MRCDELEAENTRLQSQKPMIGGNNFINIVQAPASPVAPQSDLTEKHTWENSQTVSSHDLKKLREVILQDVDQRIAISDKRAQKLEMKDTFNADDMEFSNTYDEDSEDMTDPLFDTTKSVDLMEQCISGSYSVHEKKRRRKEAPLTI